MPVLTAPTSLMSRRSAVTGCVLRPCRIDDHEALSHLYFIAYPPGVASATLEEARADISATLAGEYGEFWPAASPLVFDGGVLMAAVLTVRRASWQDAPDCPYFIEVFTHPDLRRQGLARAALEAAVATLHTHGERQVALTVEDENGPALALYRSMGFVESEFD